MIRSQRGMTLIEVLIALLILAGATVALYFSWSGSLANYRKARAYSTVALLLQKKMAELEAEIRDKPVEEVDRRAGESGDFGQNFSDYRWEIKTKPFTVPNIMPGKEQGGQAAAETVFRVISNYFEKGVREVQVTVIFKIGKKEQRHSLSTIYVDYTKELALE